MKTSIVKITAVLLILVSNIAWSQEVFSLPENKSITAITGVRTGCVTDSITGKPIEGAIVLYKWDITKSFIATTSRLGALYETTTGKDGKYTIPSQSVEIEHSLISKLEPEEVLVYRYGYTWYRVFDNKTQYFMPYAPDLPQVYSKENNIVKLQPWIDEMSHYEHIDSLRRMLWSAKAPQMENALKKEKSLAESEDHANKPVSTRAYEAFQRFQQDRKAYEKKQITRDEYAGRLQRYLEVPDCELIRCTSLALKECDDTSAIPVLIEFMKGHLYQKSFEIIFYNFMYIMDKKNVDAPQNVPQRKDIIKKIENWWQQNKAQKISGLNTAALVLATPKLEQKPQFVEIPRIDIKDFNKIASNSPVMVMAKFKGALLAGDLDKVLSCFLPFQRERYAPKYKQLKPHFKKMAEDMKGLALISQDEDTADYDLLREENGEMFGYPVSFAKDETGKWWIVEF